MGKLNNRALDGPMRLPRNKEEYLKIARETSDAWFAIWRDAYVPHLLFQPKWFRSDRDLLPRDLVYFIKEESKMSNKWLVGMVEEVKKGRDGILREVTVKYCNSTEQKLSLYGDSREDRTLPCYSRAVRKIVKIFSLEDACLEEDIKELQAKFRPDKVRNDNLVAERAKFAKQDVCKLKRSQLQTHCCVEHCKVQHHTNLNHKLEVVDSYKAVEFTEFEELAWEEKDSDNWDTGEFWGGIDLDSAFNAV